MELTEKERENWNNFKKFTKYNCKNPPERISEEKKENIRKKILEGWGRRHIAKKLHTNEGTVRRIREELGL